MPLLMRVRSHLYTLLTEGIERGGRGEAAIIGLWRGLSALELVTVTQLCFRGTLSNSVWSAVPLPGVLFTVSQWRAHKETVPASSAQLYAGLTSQDMSTSSPGFNTPIKERSGRKGEEARKEKMKKFSKLIALNYCESVRPYHKAGTFQSCSTF